MDAIEASRTGDFNGDNHLVNQIFKEYSMSAMTMQERIDKVMKKCSKKRKKLTEGSDADDEKESSSSEEKKGKAEEEKKE